MHIAITRAFVGIVILGASTLAWSADAQTLYKSKCAGCHGTEGQGKPATKAPALKNTSLDTDQIVQKITKGSPDSKAPHNKALPGISEEKAKALADFIKSMK